jgi:serine/threonine protein kinase
MDELLREWLRRYFADPARELPLIEEELRQHPPEAATRFHEEKRLIDEYFEMTLKDGFCPPEVWLPLHPQLSKGAEALIKQIDRTVRENRKARRLGRKIGPYRVLYRVGAGGMAEVYAVAKTDVEVKPRALKIIHLAEQYQDLPQPLRQRLVAELGERLRDEAAHLDEVKHSRIVAHYYDVSTDPTTGELFIVTELVEGFSLERIVTEKGGSLLPEEALSVATTICAGLVEVHKHLIHRDLTPANVLIDRDGNVKIIDFGLSQSMLPEVNGFRTGADRFHWRTRRYASPEQLRREEATAASDLYMLGKLFYFLLLYRPEWEELDDWPVPPRDDPAWHGVPPGYAELILRATAEQPCDRFPSAADMLEALRPLGGEERPLSQCAQRVRELLEENDAEVNRRVGQTLGTVAVPPRLPIDPAPPIGDVVPPPPVSQWRRVLIASGLAGLLVAVLLILNLMSGKERNAQGDQGTTNPTSPARPVPRVAFKGQSNWRLRARQGAQIPPEGLLLGDPGALYLKGGDRVTIQAELTEGPEAYFYAIQIDARGEALHLYPPGWTWKELPQGERARRIMRLPENGGDAPVADGPSGLELLLWLVRDKPLTLEDNARLRKLLTPPELAWEQPKKIQHPRVEEDLDLDPFLVENGIVRDHRGHVLLGQQRIAKDPHGQTEKLTQAIRDQQLAQYSRAVCYLFLKNKAAKAK